MDLLLKAFLQKRTALFRTHRKNAIQQLLQLTLFFRSGKA